MHVQVEAGETKTDRKIDMLQRTGLIQARQERDTDEEESVDKSLVRLFDIPARCRAPC